MLKNGKKICGAIIWDFETSLRAIEYVTHLRMI